MYIITINYSKYNNKVKDTVKNVCESLSYRTRDDGLKRYAAKVCEWSAAICKNKSYEEYICEQRTDITRTEYIQKYIKDNKTGEVFEISFEEEKLFCVKVKEAVKNIFGSY